MTTFAETNRGWVYRCDRPEWSQPMGPRCAFTDSGELICAYMLQSKLGVNDFVPVLSRSPDNGRTWSFQGPIWPHLAHSDSIFCSLSRARTGELLLFGTRTAIDVPGGPNWSGDNHGLKENELFWAVSIDSGHTWSEPRPVPMPVPGAAECTGPICADGSGVWHAAYAPYHTFDPNVRVERNRIIALRSEDRGQTWTYREMMKFADSDAGGAESWVIELADGSLLGTCWHFNYRDGSDGPNQYAMSFDGGRNWSPVRSTGIRGQSTGLAALPDGRALFIYNHRIPGNAGIGLAVAQPSADGFGVERNGLIWKAETATQSGKDVVKHDQFTDYSFGEPAVAVLPDGSLFVVYWCVQPADRGIAFLQLSLANSPAS